MKKLLAVVLTILTVLPTSLFGQGVGWPNIINSSRAIDWSKAGATIVNRTTPCGTNPIPAYSGSASTINTAIQNCPSGQFVHLGTGTFTLSSSVNLTKDNVTVRGDGPDKTILVFTGISGCVSGFSSAICMDGSFNWNQGPQHLTTFLGPYTKGTTSINLGSASGVTVGTTLILDQRNDTSDTGQVFVCSSPTLCSTDPMGDDLGRVVGGVAYSQQQYVQVTGVSSNTVTISPGLYMPNWSSGKNPGAWWATTTRQSVGLEGVTINMTNSGLSNYSGVMFWNCYNCWMKNIRSIYALGSGSNGRNHVWMQYSSKDTIRDSYFFGTRNASNLSYGIEPWQVGDVLLENNIFQQIDASILMGPCEGCVEGYNFSINDFDNNATFEFPAYWSHDVASDLLLIEGSESMGIIEDAIHGSHNFGTAFRNRAIGREMNKSTQTNPILLQSHSRYVNLIGNVLGLNGYHSTYQNAVPNAPNCEHGIYQLGWSGSSCGTQSPVALDPLVETTLMRWGNYDTVTGTSCNTSTNCTAGTRFVNAEVPTGLAQFSNAVPASQTLPASFYLTAKPAWWNSSPWPAIGPDVANGTMPVFGTNTTYAQDAAGGHAYIIPAFDCYKNVMGGNGNGTGAVLPFNADNCYAASTQTPPAPPTGLTTTVN